MLIIKQMTPIIFAFLIDIFPLAIGRFLLLGCLLSCSISIMSLIIYTKEEAKQKAKKACKEAINFTILNKFKENINAANTKRFFIQCFGLNK